MRLMTIAFLAAAFEWTTPPAAAQPVLAFSSLPKAVEFMQPAVVAGRIKDVNKIAKFRWEVARDWPFPVMLNPSDEIFDTHAAALLAVDPDTAEAPDE